MSQVMISDAARSTGFSVSALRFYEKEDMVVPGRSASGYRTYSDNDLDALRFVRRGKQLGLSLDEIKELLALLEDEDCEPVQARIQELVGNRIAQAQNQIAELVGFTAQLQNAMARLTAHTASGACDDRCGCKSDPPVSETVPATDVIPLAGTGSGTIACSLEPDLVGDRVDDWNAVLAASKSRTSLPNGIRVHFDDVDVSALAGLAAAEQECCSFFRFGLRITADEVTLDVTGPQDARAVITSVFGATA